MSQVSGVHLDVIAPAGNTAPFKEMSQLGRVVGNAGSDLTGLRLEPHISRNRTRNKCVTAQPTARSVRWLSIKFIA